MKVKELQKTVNIAWSPQPQYPIYLAAGSAAQQIDASNNATLEIYATNLSDTSYDLQLKATQPSQYRFQKLIWSPTGHDTTHRNGLLVGGCESGHVMIYSASKLLAQEDGLIARQDKHTGAVSGLDFNPFQTNLLASSAAESEIFIWDLNNTSTHMNPGAKTQPLEDVQNVAWNRQVQHILASVFSTRCVIWDLRKSEQIIKLSDTQSRVRWHAIQWHPAVATQLWLASEDDQAPVVQLWDLRYATAPAKTLQIHQRGVLGMSWCPNDTELMVSCGKDNRIFCWNPNSDLPEGEILSEVASAASWYSNVHWCPRNPALIAASSLEGNVSIYSLFGGTQQQVQTANKIADSFPGMEQISQAPMPQQSMQIVYHDLKRAPKMLKRACGVAFGFGGKLVSFNGNSKNVQISQVITEPKLVERANALEKTLLEADFKEYCRKRADEMPDQHGRYLWYFIKASFEQQPREELLNLLGYNMEDIDNKLEKYVPKEEEETVDQLSQRLTQLTHSDSSEVDCDHSTTDDISTDVSQTANVIDNNTVFDNISQQQKEIENVTEKPASQFQIPSGEHSDSLITEALLTGNLEAAVELCLEAKRTSEALIIASTINEDYLQRIQKRYLQQQQGDLSHVINALVTRDWMELVSGCAVESWKEALVAALKHGERKVVDICEHLGDRLLQERPTDLSFVRNAMICFICSGSIDKLVIAWYHLKQVEQRSDSYKLQTNELQELAEFVLVMAKALEQSGIYMEIGADNHLYAEFISEYAELLVSQGALQAAQTYINTLTHGANVSNPMLKNLHERIYNAVNQKPQRQINAQQNMFGRPQAARGSISQTTPLMNNWNAATVNNSYKPPGVAMPAQNAVKPLQPYANETVTQQPPRPLSTASSQGGTTTGSLISGRSKYVVDPSVANGGMGMGYGQMYSQQTTTMPAANIFQPAAPTMQPTTGFNSNQFNMNPMQQQTQQPNIMQPTNPYNNTTYGVPPMEGSQIAAPPLQNIQRNPTPPPGWNDPPALKSTRAFDYCRNHEMSAEHAGTRKWKKIINHVPDNMNIFNSPSSSSSTANSQDYFLCQAKRVDQAPLAAPITHPLFGVDPNQNANPYADPNALYGQQNNGMPPPPMGNSNQMGMNDYSPLNNNNMQQNFQNMPSQQWNTTPANMNFADSQQQLPSTQRQQRQPEPPKEKAPLPEEYVYLQTVLEELKNQCLSATNDARMKRKFVDVNKRLENLYDCLRDGRLIPATIGALNQMVQYIQIGDYGNALQIHTQIAFGSDFSQCAGFMPGLKVLMQSASELHIALR